MAVPTKFQDFVNQLALNKHALNTDTWKVALCSGTPVNTNTILSNLTQTSGTSTGYTTGGADATRSMSYATGTVTVIGTKVVWTCATNPMGPFQHVVLYNDTQTSPVDPLIMWWDYGTPITLQVGETFSVKFNNSDTTGTILTLT